MIRSLDGTGRLYLSKGDQTVYIENCKISQHHIDGIRFLYKQYKKKKSGVIITDTSGYGRKMQIVLFLKAVRHLFEKPVLVLCHEGAEHDWMEQFQTWTDLCEDVVLETQKPFIKKRVLINMMANLPAFCRRDWSVVVINGDKFTQQVLGLPFKADYKIWLTPVHMKDNLNKFAQIYHWLYPKEKFDAKDFAPDKSNPKDVVDKAVRLDALLEDIVLKNDEPDFSREPESNENDGFPPIRVSRKNKDATGTKIKRTKRKIYDDDDDVPLSKTKKDVLNIPTPSSGPKSTITPNNIFEITLSANENVEIADDSSLDNFKRKSIEEFNEDLLGDEEPSAGLKLDTLNSQSQVNLYFEPDSSTDVTDDALYTMDTLVFDNTCNQTLVDNEPVKDIVESSENLDTDKDDERIDYIPDCDVEAPCKLDSETKNNSVFKLSSNTDIKLLPKDEKAVNEISKTENGTGDMASKTLLENFKIEPNKERVLDDKKYFTKREVCRDLPPICDDVEDLDVNHYKKSPYSSSICDKISSDIKEFDASKESPVDEIKKSEDNEINLENENHTQCETDDDEKRTESNEVQTKSIQNEHIDDNKPVTNEAVTNALKRNAIEDKMKELEEKALKKFKGSILDSLF